MASWEAATPFLDAASGFNTGTAALHAGTRMRQVPVQLVVIHWQVMPASG